MYQFKIKDCVLINCISYTVVSVILSILAVSPKLMTTYTHFFSLQLFSSTCLVSISLYFLTKIPVESAALSFLFMFVDIISIELFLGGIVYKWFTLDFMMIAEVILISFIVQLVSYLIMLWQNNIISKQINQKIKEKQNESNY